MSVKWNPVDTSQAKPQQWYFNGEPCDLLEWGMRKGESAPAAQKVRLTATGKTVIVWAKGNNYPGLTYEVFEHKGRA